jgi:CRP-like cAMP-binding protein
MAARQSARMSSIAEDELLLKADTNLIPADLKSNRFFSGLSEKEIGELLKSCAAHTFAPGEQAVREGDASRHFFVILSGRIGIEKALYAGDERHLCELEAGDFFGEMAFLDGCPRSATATCVEAATLLKFDRDSFDKLAVRRPRIAYKITLKIALALGERLRASNDVVESIFSNPNKTILELRTRLLKIQSMLLRR